MGKSVYIVWLFAVIFGTVSCHQGGKLEEMEGDAEPVILNINVALSDLLPESRAGEDAAANEHEKMNTLRVIVVNSHNDVEGNVLLTSGGANKEEQIVPMRHIKSKDTKTIYLIANEETKKKTIIAGMTETTKLVDYDFDKIKSGTKFPTEEIFALKVSLSHNSDQLSPDSLTGPLPMSEWYRVWIPSVAEYESNRLGEDDPLDGFFVLKDEGIVLPPEEGKEEEIYGYQKTLWITRAAVKFTCQLKNETGLPLTLKEVEIDKMAKCEYFMPRVTERKGHEITGFVVPSELTANSGYYTFKLKQNLPLTIPDGEQKKWEPVYLLEGKYMDSRNEDEKLNYRVSLTVDNTHGEVILSDYLPNLSQLPRNTHVVLDITVKGPKIECEVHVHPYISVPLEPDFGL
ncbi:MAG: hypothetical protein K2L23_05750 [Odoribacter sp.]|nr:hypothetical protein [Odoribacter sp.]